jgi:DNA-binding NtrC family response regulator
MPAKILNMTGKQRILWVAGPGVAPPDVSFATAPGVAEALRRIEAREVDLLVAGFPLPEWTPAELVEAVALLDPHLPVLVLTETSDAAELGSRIRAVLAGCMPLSVPSAPAPWKQFLVGQSRAMEDIDRLIRLVGPRRSTVLITGETGTGKELAARAIHLASPRADRPLVAVNCSALPENLLEAELFGYVKGAFTGAQQQRIGRFEQADGSTLFLDEIGELPLELQAKLLRVLQEREFQRLGSSETVEVDVRVMAASNVDLAERVRQGRFREDLYYRLNVVPLKMPALRERRTDIGALVSHFVTKICRLEKLPLKRVLADALEVLSDYAWPGNVRQLENAVEMAVVLSGARAALDAGDFPLPAAAERRAPGGVSSPAICVPDNGLDFAQTVQHIERSILEQVLVKTRGNKKMAADLLRLKRTTLSAKLRSLEAAV